MRTLVVSRLALFTLWLPTFLPVVWLPATVARASIDAVDEPMPGEPRQPASPPPSLREDGTRVRTWAPTKEDTADMVDDARDQAPGNVIEARPAPARHLPSVVAPNAAPDSGVLAPGSAVASSVPSQNLGPIAMPQGTIADLLSHFRARQKALLDLDAKKVDAESQSLRELKSELGFTNFETVGKALTREGERRLQGHLGAQARQSARLAVDLSPGLPEAWWLLARAEFSSDGVSGLGKGAKAVWSAVEVEFANPLGRRALMGNLVVALLWAALATLTLALVLLAVGVLRYALHDLHHLFPKGASPVQTGLLGLILLSLPWLFRLGPFAMLATLAVASWIYLDRVGQVVTALTLLLVAATPFVLGEVAARTAVSPLALDLWTAETDLDAEGAVARLTVLAREPQPSEAVLFVLAHRAKRLGRLDEAVALYERAQQLSAGRADLETNLGNVLLLKGDLSGAQTLYEAAIDHDPSRAAPYFDLGQDFNRLLQLDQSQEAQRHALELDRPLVEAHLGHDLRANVYLIDAGLVFGDVSAVGSSAENLNSSGVRVQVATWFFGRLLPVWPALVLLTGLSLAVLSALQFRLRPSAACRKCGRPVCGRCDPGLPDEALCGQCVNVFLRKSVADPPARIRKEARTKAYQIMRLRTLRTLAVLSGAGGHIAMGEVALGTGLLFGICFFLVMASQVANVLRAPEYGITAPAVALVSGLVGVAFYVFALRDLFGKTR